MDSMRSLNRSLPANQPSEELLRFFKTAALSVTNLYKEAASSRSAVRQAGYQDALDDLLAFLDKENLGLGDGEGWQVRQWATTRLDGGPQASDSEEETSVEKRRTSPTPQATSRPAARPEQTVRSSSPPAAESPAAAESSPIKVESPEPALAPTPADASPPPAIESPEPPSNPALKTESFTFRSSHSYPRDVDMAAQDSSETNPTVPPKLEAQIRSHRSHRLSTSHNRHNARNGSTRLAGAAVGSKRKLPLPDFFDITGFTGSKDPLSKRSRHG